VALLAVFLLAGALSASAQDVFASYNKPGNVNLYVAAGWGGAWLLGAGVSAEVIIGKFDLGPIPFQWGLMGMGLFNFLPGFALGAGGMATLHMGLVWNLDFFIGLGLGAEFLGGFGLGLAQTAGVCYKLSNSLTLLLTDSYISYSGLGLYGVGLQLKL
jgi:hypothetical protein